MRRSGIALSLVAMLAVAAGCGGESGRDYSAEDVQRAWVQNVEGSNELAMLIQRLEANCAQAHGVAADHSLDIGFVAGADTSIESLMGVAAPRITVEEAEAHGYRAQHPEIWENFIDRDGSAEPTEPDREALAVMYGSDFVEAFYADPEATAEADLPGRDIIYLDEDREAYVVAYTDGCKGTVSAELFGDELASYHRDRSAAAPWLGSSLSDHADYIAAEADWASCMREFGYAFDGMDDWTWQIVDYARDSLAQFEDLQKELAVADGDCAKRENVNDRFRAVFEEVSLAYFAEHGAEVDIFAFNERVEDLKLRAQEMLESDKVFGNLTVWGPRVVRAGSTSRLMHMALAVLARLGA
ncbi:hypothetical protein [Natronoglycomyces albus]|uniref:Uncharacterized protein n=1 Tax=Natronoglycomyces albus TaxID=2811108 RepID=A0A895XQV0_9ACTN|nr:hypothetical protein [Natronoglycomyces albus]QSB05749.1 hypothetical protein JQS30_02125 [Natronoglycomyces albus]